MGKSNKLDIPMPNSKKAPIVGKMPWLKKDGRARNAIPKFQLTSISGIIFFYKDLMFTFFLQHNIMLKVKS